ncbi:MAG: outer membrane beta-barrel domain-containing protein [Deltaproteobacteria bacterium]|nr:outer membrane beta-barrel domain-containing protein [Deltaproteobacteria bacterium]
MAAALAVPSPAHAQLVFDNEVPRVFSIQERPYRLGHEFQLGLGVLPLDAFYVGITASASYTYHFSDFWAWEIAGGSYSLNKGTGLATRLFDEYGVVPVRGGGERIVTFASTSVVVKPLFGKLAVFNSDVVYSETFFVAGVGPMRKGEFWRPSADVGAGFRFWTSPVLSWRLDIRDVLVFSSLAPENNLLVLVSASFNYRESGTKTVAAP